MECSKVRTLSGQRTHDEQAFDLSLDAYWRRVAKPTLLADSNERQLSILEAPGPKMDRHDDHG